MGTLFALVIACAPVARDPDVRAVTPSKGWGGEATDIVIEGEHLLPVVSLGAEAPVGGSFAVWIEGPEGAADPGSVELRGVQRLDSNTVTAEVPAGVEPGLYDLRVRTPAGGEDTLPGAYRVTVTRADHLAFSVTRASWELGEFATLLLSVLAPDDSLVATDMVVEVEAESPTEAAGIEFAEAQLGHQEAFAGGAGIRGSLGPDGEGTVLVRSTLADDVLFTARAVGEEGVDDASLLLSWQTGSLNELDVTLPFSPFRAEAHVPFTIHIALRDEFGNLLPDAAARVSLSDDCDGLRTIVDLVGEANVEVVLDTACAENHITLFNTSGEVASEAFEVVAGDHAGYRVTAAPGSDVQAGVTPVLVAVEAVDAWGNHIDEQAAPLTLGDALGGLDPRSSCPDTMDGVAFCTAWLLRAGSDTVTVTDDLGLAGTSNAVVVEPAAASSVVVEPAALATIAGNEVGVVVTVLDAFANVVEIEPGGVDAVTFTDDTGTIACAWTGPVGDGSHAFDCRITGASDADSITAELARMGVSGTAAEPVVVHNAELADVDVGVPASVVAGAPFALTLRGFDVYGNPYLRQTDPVLDLDDSTGTLSVTTATLGSSGEITTTGAIKLASGSARVRARQAGTLLGSSSPMVVSAGTPANLAVEVAPWVGVGESLDVTAYAVDAWGNAVASHTGTLSFSSTGDACGSATGVDLVDGTATASLDCAEVRLGARVSASDGTLSGDSELFDVVDFTCAAGPTADLLLAGGVDPAVCLALGEATVDVDATGSSSSSGLALFSFLDDEDVRVRNALGTGSFTWEGAGAHYLQALVVDALGCADETDGWAWLGEDDGEPTGPVALSSDAAEVTTGGSVTITAVARDCTGDLAVGQSLLVRADLGEAGGAASGTGLTLTLDAAGEGSLTWSFPAGHAADATFFAGTDTLGAYGTVGVSVTQDSARPHLIDAEPAGIWSDTVEELRLTFDEALLESTITGVTVTGPDGDVPVTAALSDTVLVLTPATPIEAATGAFTVNLPSSLRDLAGNRLDGAWTGAAAATTVSFGDVADSLPTLAGCAAGATEFRPDGDDGAATESEEIEITPVASASPSWWELQVVDDAGATVRTARFAGTTAGVSWDGRSDDGRVAPAEEYSLVVSAVDAADNRATACTRGVRLAQRLELP